MRSSRPETAQELTQETTTPRRSRTLALLALSAALGLAPVLAAAGPAQAAELDAITTTTINANAPTAPITVWQRFTVDASWELPAGAQTGDTFSLSYPGPVIGFETTFPLLDSADVSVGDCVVSATNIVCTLNSYVETHHNVSGSLYFYAQSSETNSSGSFVFTTGGGVPLTVNIPGGEIGVGEPGTAPTEPVKWGWQNDDGTTLSWQIFVPAEYLASPDGSPVVLTDTYDARLTFDADSLRASWFTAANWNSPDSHELSAGTGPESFTVTSSPETHSFTLVVNEPVVDTGRMYAFSYKMDLPTDAANGDVFTNQLTANELQVQTWPVEFARAGGNGGGTLNPTTPTPTPTPETPAVPTSAAQEPTPPVTPAAQQQTLAKTGVNPAAAGAALILLFLAGATALGISGRKPRKA